MAEGCFRSGVGVVDGVVGGGGGGGARGEIFNLVFVSVGSVVRISCHVIGAVKSMVHSLGWCDSHGVSVCGERWNVRDVVIGVVD